jgi:hypothetical protein
MNRCCPHPQHSIPLILTYLLRYIHMPPHLAFSWVETRPVNRSSRMVHLQVDISKLPYNLAIDNLLLCVFVT